ncbi:MAG TPA: hypothetical protein VGK73_36575 [Polyangiaceae bacterium]
MTRAPGRAEQTLKLARQGNAVDDALRFAERAVSYCTPECREAVALAVCELGENLIKYGENGGDPHAGTIGVSVEGSSVRVRAVNRVTSLDDAKRVAELVSELDGAGASVQELYLKRLQTLFSNPDEPRTQLGLLRMAFEGGFRLSCTFDAPELQIIAERTC